MRRRRPALSRTVLAVFVLSWLTGAALPCTMACGMAGSAPSAQVAGHEGHGGHAGHEPAGGSHHEATGDHHCMYCPPGHDGESAGDHDTDCSYPHGPRIDVRADSPVLGPVPSSFALARLTSVAAVSGIPVADDLEGASRRRLAIHYCRFIE